MKLLPLALILIIIFALYYVKFIRTIKEHTETFDNDKLNEDRTEYAKKDFRDYDSILNPKIKGTASITSFYKLKVKTTEGYDNYNLKNKDSGSIKEKGDLKKEMEKCSLLVDCNQSDDHPKCGYCFPLNKFMYGNKDGPIVDGQINKHNICPSLENGGTGWVPPPDFGGKTKDECLRMNSQKLCQDAGSTCAAPDGNGAARTCGWCPKTQKFMVKELVSNKYLPKYRDKGKWGLNADVCEWKGLEEDGTITDNNHIISGGKACADFQRKYPCVTPKATTGPHTDACYRKLWKKTKCSGDPITRSPNMTAINQRNYGKPKWDTLGWPDSLNAMKLIHDKITNSDIYDLAVDLNKTCFDGNPPIDSCEEKFKPRPQDCSKRIYNEQQCKPGGYLHPDKVQTYHQQEILEDKWNDNNDGWRNWNNSDYKQEIRKHKLQARGVGNGKHYSYRRRSSQYCGEQISDPPDPKPCWSDMKRMLSVMPKTIVKDKWIIFNSGSPILMLLKGSFGTKYPTFIESANSKERAELRNAFEKKGAKYYFHEKTLALKDFPYWDIIKVCKDHWDSNWDTFGKTLAYKTPFIDWKTTHITVTKGSGFTKLLGKSKNKNTALNNGLFYDDDKSNVLELWKKSYQHKDFPYWDFLILIKTMSDNTLDYTITN